MLRDPDAELPSELDSLRQQNAKQQTEIGSLQRQNAKQQTEINSLLDQNAKQQTKLESLKAHRSTNDSHHLELLATETECQINETSYPFNSLPVGLGINTSCDQWPETNVTFGSAPLLPFPASNTRTQVFFAGNPFMSRTQVFFAGKPLQLSDPDPELNFTSILNDGVFDDWLGGL
jgi:hypothetical protein